MSVNVVDPRDVVSVRGSWAAGGWFIVCRWLYWCVVAVLCTAPAVYRRPDGVAMVPLASRTRAAVEQAVDGRDGGPLLRNRWGNRMTRNDLAAAVAASPPTPTPLRAPCTPLVASPGCSLRDVQDIARQADLRTTIRYNHPRWAWRLAAVGQRPGVVQGA